MKKLFAVIAVLAVMLSFAGCGGTKYEVSDYDTAATNDLVQLFIKQRTVTDETEEVTLTIENLTDKDYTYDAGQRLEIWQALVRDPGQAGLCYHAAVHAAGQRDRRGDVQLCQPL